jgi:hypothetical protein
MSQGDVYDDASPPGLLRMRTMVAEVEQNENYPWHKPRGDLTANEFGPES